MKAEPGNLIAKVWNYAHVMRDQGVSGSDALVRQLVAREKGLQPSDFQGLRDGLKYCVSQGFGGCGRKSLRFRQAFRFEVFRRGQG